MTPVAIIGLACRFPGAKNPTRFWANLVGAVSSVGAVPKGRWADRRPVPGAPPAGTGGFLPDPDLFDAEFFGVSRREAQYMDPQQRLLLELAWECVEDAGLSADGLRDTRWGVFVGADADDFRMRYFMNGSLDRFGHMGTSSCMLANRVSHHLGLRGPSEVTASGQSSSLVALHRAVGALRLGECSAALVAGVNLNLLGAVTEQVRLWGGLSPDGRCHTFDERANGYVRGEGAGCVALKPLDAAVRDGDHVYAVIRGSATANDAGRGAGGLGVPAAEAQREAITAAHEAAGVTAERVAYVELHGTGTAVGDPVEAEALGATVGRHRSKDDPLPVGSVKTNIGHLEAAAGIAGLIKACLMVHHGHLSPTLNHGRPHPGIPLDEHNIRVVTRPERRTFGPRDVIGVSSFGMGGTHAHVLLGAPDDRSAPYGAEGSPDRSADSGKGGHEAAVWCLSGCSRDAVLDLARALLDHPFDESAGTVSDIGRALSVRSHREYRAAVLGSDWNQIRRGLAKIVSGHDLAVPAEWMPRTPGRRDDAVRAASAYVHAGDVTGVRGHLGERRRAVPLLPTYPFQRRPFPLPDGHAGPGTRPVPRRQDPDPGVRSDAPPSGAADSARPAPRFLDRWSTARTATDRSWAMRSLLEDELAAVLDGPAPAQAFDRSFSDLGVDSMTLLEFADAVADQTGVGIPETVLFDHPTLNELADYLTEKLEGQRA
ncbi:beta-ketoacyl synthase N-terminal-like domain-containing protein [Nocardiopsis lucentensis]|uniref:beta-ketoacyl synthase N-terminal-like domain-containing protein n=1 Tax=Nocardiopsis lucentensis TaxID=53441 RepID=UPI0003485950|nr:beta-ketoacyl synthase N-terminal-like domain-containing protein [Nocardiopsis lucentensis]